MPRLWRCYIKNTTKAARGRAVLSTHDSSIGGLGDPVDLQGCEIQRKSINQGLARFKAHVTFINVAFVMGNAMMPGQFRRPAPGERSADWVSVRVVFRDQLGPR